MFKLNTLLRPSGLVLVLASTLWAPQGMALTPEAGPSIEVERSESTSGSTVGLDWPIVKTITNRYLHPETQVEVVEQTVIRQAPQQRLVTCGPVDAQGQPIGEVQYPSVEALSGDLTGAEMLANCTYERPETRTSSTSYAGVTGVLLDRGDWYQNNGTGGFFKHTYIEVYWTRPTSAHGVANAYTLWGCTGDQCTVCGADGAGGGFSHFFGPFTPTFYDACNSTHSYYNEGGMPAFQSQAFGTNIARLTYNVVLPGGALSPLLTLQITS